MTSTLHAPLAEGYPATLDPTLASNLASTLASNLDGADL